MRGEQEMLDLILGTARADDRIRAVIMNGSRVNPNAPRDILQDFDILYIVTEVESFKADPAWIDRFGAIMILQMPEMMLDPPPLNNGCFIYLMQFTDGNRIDLALIPLALLAELEADNDSLSRVLLDKDGLITWLKPPSDRDYLPTPPTDQAFADCCNEFWWVSLYVGKGLWREEIVYAKYVLDQLVRAQLLKMLTWYVGVQTQFQRNPGKQGKYLKRYLSPDLWSLLERTYADATYERTWDSLFAMGDLFRIVAREVATTCDCTYPERDDRQVSAHLRHLRSLPKNAPAIY